MRVKDEYDGDQCVILPTNYLASVDAAVELFDEDLAQASKNLEVSGLEYGLGRALLRVGTIVAAIWLVPAVWMHCQ